MSQQAVHSAPFPGTHPAENAHLFREWRLERPADAIAVFLLVRNIDAYASGTLVTSVRSGVAHLVESIIQQGNPFCSWKRAGKLVATQRKVLGNLNSVDSAKENTTEPSGSSAEPPAKRTKRVTRRRRSTPRSSYSPV